MAKLYGINTKNRSEEDPDITMTVTGDTTLEAIVLED